MLKIIIGNSYSQLTGFTPDQFKAIRKALSYKLDDQAAFFAGAKYSNTKYLIDKRGMFPTGLLHRVQKVFPTALTQSSRSIPALGSFVGLKAGIVPYPAQNEALKAVMAHGSGTVSMPTGTGKSLVIALIAAQSNLKTLIVVPTVELKAQLKTSLIGLLNNASHITVENIDSSRLKALTGFDRLIIDESHHAAARTYHKLNRTAWKGIYYRVCLTATPFRNKTEETMLFEAICGQVIYRLNYQEAVANGYIVPVEAYTIPVPKQETDAYTYREVYDALVVNNNIRNSIISSYMTDMVAAGWPTLCLVREIAHGEILASLTGLPFVNGQDAESRQYIADFNSGKIKGLIGTTGVIGEGVDTKPCSNVIIAGLGKAKSAFMQQVGRAVRTYPGKEAAQVFIFEDRSHKYLLRHFRAQAKILLQEYGIKPIKLETQR